MPKRELHCHIDGSVSLPLMTKLLGRQVLIGEASVPLNCRSLTEYLRCFDLPVSLMQTPENIKAVTCDVIRQARQDHITYIEPRFCPMLHTGEGLTNDLVVEAALEGLKEGEKRYGVRSQLILCGLRHIPIEDDLKMLDTAEKYIGRGVCAVDLAGDESRYSNRDFEEYLREIKRRDLPFVIHSGETGSVENVRIAIEYGAKRIGHGIALMKDPDLMKEAALKRVGIEMCPSSNLQTKAIDSLRNYPLKLFLDAGVPASIHTDNRTVTDTTLTDEFWLIYSRYNDDGIMETLLRNAEETSFPYPGGR